MKFLQSILLILVDVLFSACTSTVKNPPPTAKQIDLKRYQGRWHEIARLPMPFQKADEAAIAEYNQNSNGTVSVHNIAVRPDGSQHDIRGYATVLNPPMNTKLTVRFNTWFGSFIPVAKEGNYWVLYVDNDYQHAIVGTPDRKYLWILNRTPQLPDEQFQEMVLRAAELGCDLSGLIKDPTQ